MKKVIFIIPSVFTNGGMERVTIQIANELSKLEKYKIGILSLSNSRDNPKYRIDSSVSVNSLPFDKFSLRKNWLHAANELKKQFSDNFEGIVVVDDVGYTIPVYHALKSNKKIKLICWSHMNYSNGRVGGFAWFGKRLAVSKFDKLIVLTKEDKSYYRGLNKRNNIVQIYNPMNEGITKSSYNKESKKIISCGRLEKIKGFDILIDVAKKVFSKYPDWSWDIYGNGPEEKKLKEMIISSGLQDHVILKGFVNNILDIYKDYAIYVFTSRREGCPMAMIEAQQSGLPMVSFDFKCGPRDLITENINGYIIKNYNTELMAERISQLISDEELRQKFSDNSLNNYDELKMDYVLKKWQTLFDN